MPKPNILLIMTDQQRFDSLSCYGNRAITTPHLDSLAQTGIRFDNCYVNCPICTPSRASLLTGKHMQGHGVYRVYDNLPEDEVLLPEHLQRLGYQTALFGKLHVSSNHYEAEQRHPHDGFDMYHWCNEGPLRMDSPFHAYRQWLEAKDPEFCQKLEQQRRKVGNIPAELHLSHWAATETAEFIANRQSDQPFFCMTSLFDPHDPYDNYPAEMREQVDATEMNAPVPPDESSQQIYGIRQERELSYLGRSSDFSAHDVARIREGYHAAVAFIDAQIGHILEALQQSGQADNTLIIFTSDHGDMLGDHGLFVKGAFFYDPSVKVPLLMRGPGIPVRTNISQPVQPHDLAATILTAAGMERTSTTSLMPDSHDLIALACGPQARRDDPVVCCYRNSGINQNHQYWSPEIHATMLRNQQYKLNVYHSPAPDDLDKSGQLFDMNADPQEQNDLWDNPDYASVKTTLMQQLSAWLVAQESQHLGSRGGQSLPQAQNRMANKLK